MKVTKLGEGWRRAPGGGIFLSSNATVIALAVSRRIPDSKHDAEFVQIGEVSLWL